MTGQDDSGAVVAALAAIPGFEATKAGDFTLERQGGLTNRVYKLDFGDKGSVILRLPGKGTEAWKQDFSRWDELKVQMEVALEVVEDARDVCTEVGGGGQHDHRVGRVVEHLAGKGDVEVHPQRDAGQGLPDPLPAAPARC